MIDLFRAFLSVAFGIRWVVLVDFDGERNVRRVRWQGGRACAARWSFATRDIYLADGGLAEGASYVVAWEIYDPFAPKRLPTPAIS